MESLKAWFYAYHLTAVRDGVSWRDADWKANRLIKCAKGEPFNGYVEFAITRNGVPTRRRYKGTDSEALLAVLCRAVASKLRDEINGPFSLVPIPNKSALVGDDEAFRTERMADRVVSAIGERATVRPVLRWKRQIVQAHKGGPRSTRILTPELEIVGKVGEPVVIFDDVITSGSHMISCCRKLCDAGVEPLFGIAIGRTTDIQHAKMIGWQTEELTSRDLPLGW